MTVPNSAGSASPAQVASKRAPIGGRPTADAATTWVHQADTPSAVPVTVVKAPAYTARLTVDVTPDLRGRIKVAAFKRGVTVADMLRALLESEFTEEQS